MNHKTKQHYHNTIEEKVLQIREICSAKDTLIGQSPLIKQSGLPCVPLNMQKFTWILKRVGMIVDQQIIWSSVQY